MQYPAPCRGRTEHGRRSGYRRLALGAAFAALLVGAAACGSTTGVGPVSEVEATIDEIVAPATVARDETLTFTVRGTAGPNLCYDFARLEEERSDGRLTLTAIATRTGDGDTVCAQQISEFEVTGDAAPPFAAGTFELAVQQDGSVSVLDRVEVR